MSTPLPPGLAAGGRAAHWAGPGAAVAFLDVDGTTLELDPQPSAAVVEAAARATAAGVRLGFATGRLPRGLRAVHAGLAPGGTVADVVHNGAAVLSGGELLASWPLPQRAAHQLVRWCLDQGIYAEVYSGAAMHVTDRRAEVRIAWEEVSGDPDGDAADLLVALADGTARLDKATIDVFEVGRTAEVVAVAQGFGLHVEHSTAPFLPGVPVLNVTAPGVTKGTALRWWAERTQTPLERVLVLGDGLNDVSMLQVAGTAVAMGQAGDQVRAAAHLVTGTVGADGAATVLDRLAEGAL